MNETRTKKRRMTIIRCLLYLVGLAWFVHFAYVRWTTPPACVIKGVDTYTSNQSSNRLRNAIHHAANYYGTDLDKVLDELGEAAVNHEISTPPISDWQLYFDAMNCQQRLVNRLNSQRDVSLKIRDIMASARLMELTGAVHQYQGYSREWFAALERDADHLSQEDRVRLIAYFCERASLPFNEYFTIRFAIPDDIDSHLDQYFTDDGNGNGWLVVSAVIEPEMPGWRGGRSRRYCGAVNVASPIFNDRKTVAEKYAHIRTKLRDCDHGTGAQRRQAWESAKPELYGLSILDGPRTFSRFFYVRCWEEAVLQRTGFLQWAVRVAAIAYERDHGKFPPSADVLVPDYFPPEYSHVTNSVTNMYLDANGTRIIEFDQEAILDESQLKAGNERSDVDE